jgi:23S rRNA (uridine2552-2'-O)-methyltransferase
MKPRSRPDHYARRAREERFPARSVYKLEEIQKRFQILKRAGRVLDLGCFPGSWLLLASQIVGERGLVVGVDVAPVTIQLPSNTQFVRKDVLDWDTSFIENVGTGFDVVLSDMAPSTTGNKFVDGQQSLELSGAALAIACLVLKPGGAFVCKVFQGPDVKGYLEKAKSRFDRVVQVKPKSSRRDSREIFVTGLGKRKER